MADRLGLGQKFLKDQPLFLRVKFNVGENPALGATYGGIMVAGRSGKNQSLAE